MSQTALLSTESRELNFTKGELNRFRKDGKVPAVLSGKGMKSIPLFINIIDFKKIFAANGKIFELEANNKKHLVNAKNIQTNALGNEVLHLDFVKLNRNQETTVNVAVVLIGEAPGAKAGGVIQIIEEKIELTGIPRDIPESIEIDISALELGDNIHASDIKLAKGVKLEVAPEKTIVTCSAPKVQAEAETTETEETVEATGETEAPAETEAKKEE